MTENAPETRPVIVAGVDGSPTSREALRWAAEEARLRTATLRVVCGWEWSSPFNLIGPALEYAAPDADTPSMEELTRAKAEEVVGETLGEEPGVPVEVRVVQGPATRVLVDASEGATLIVVGTRGHSGLKGAVLGSVSRHVTQHARCNVVVVRDSRDLGAGE
ncbi:universal stress protein [Streptomyces albidoflavus]